MKTSSSFRFIRKPYGRGRVPATWQGRLVILVYLVFVLARSIQFPDVNTTNQFTRETFMKYVLPIVLATAVLIGVCYRKGESPKRQRGPEKKH